MHSLFLHRNEYVDLKVAQNVITVHSAKKAFAALTLARGFSAWHKQLLQLQVEV